MIKNPPFPCVTPAKSLGDRFANAAYQMWVAEALAQRWDVITKQYFGYDPQKLLPAPPFEREFMQSMSEWAAEQIKLPYTEFANSVLRDSVIGDGFIDFETHSDHPFVHIDLFRDYVRDNSGPVDPVVLVGGDAAAHLEAARKTIHTDEAFREVRLSQQMVNYVYGMLIHETIGGSLSPRGKITIYDYDDGTYIDLEGEGELPGAQQCIIDFYAKPPPREHAAPRARRAVPRPVLPCSRPDQATQTEEETMKLKKRKPGFADRLIAKGRARQGKTRLGGQEALIGCALVRDGVEHGRLKHYRSHSDIRRDLGDENPYNTNPYDEMGFLTSKGRFVGRREASVIAVLAGQASPMYQHTDILSGDIRFPKVQS